MPDVTSIGASLTWGQMPSGAGVEKPRTIHDAAQQFEALLIGQMLRTAREAGSGEGWMGTGEDSTGTSIMEFAEQQFAQLLSNGGGLGLSKLVTEGLSSPAPSPSTAKAQP
jgi:peptidoglycan hydrolase FlgJ